MIADAADGTALSLLFHLNSAAWGRAGVEFDPSATVPRKVFPDPCPIPPGARRPGLRGRGAGCA